MPWRAVTVLAALSSLQDERPGQPTLNEIAERAGMHRMTVYGVLQRLRIAGLVGWRDGSPGTYHARVGVVPGFEDRARTRRLAAALGASRIVEGVRIPWHSSSRRASSS